jgi:hypothetical protein
MSLNRRILLQRGLAIASLVAARLRPAQARADVYQVLPSEADPRVTRFTNVGSWIVHNASASPQAELLVFLPPTGGSESGFPFERFQLFFGTATNLGYNVIGLQCNNRPAVVQMCQADPDPACSGAFREKRSFGDDVTPVIDDTPPEAIISRLVNLLVLLVRRYPDQGWERYLNGDEPNWGRLALGGHSQGAGMAAYIAKKKEVARVVLLSSPRDVSGPDRRPAPWLSMPSATPLDRWYALRHVREPQSDALARAYETLGIPPSHVRVVNLEPEPGPQGAEGPLRYHVSVIGDLTTPRTQDGAPAYGPDWAYLLGRSP